MKPIALSTLADFAGGRLRRGGDARLIAAVTTDSRQAGPGRLFVALAGERFDAHDFVPQVIAAGAAAVMVSRVDPSWDASADCAVIEVDDTLRALQDLARGYRAWHQPLLIGLTGSNGKTSTKDLTAAVMACKGPVRATLGNLNNHIGVPLTLLSLEDGDECAVVEMGMNHPGEIKTLVDIALPDAAIVTNIGMAHIEHMGSRDAIAWEKGTLPANVHAEGVVVLPAADAYTPLLARHCQATVLTAGVGAGDVRATALRPDAQGTHFKLDFAGECVDAFLPVLGNHMVANAALAACMGWAQGVAPEAIAGALAAVRLTGGRMQTRLVNGVLFIDDSYNANPDSMRAGLVTLAELRGPGRKVAVLGRMGELGVHAESGHREVGAFAAGLGLDAVCSVGDEAAWITEAARAAGLSDVRHFADHAACAEHLWQCLAEGDAVLLKGSRSAGMEKILTCFQTR